MSFLSREIKPYVERTLYPVVDMLSSKGIHPNLITLGGFFLVAIGSLALYYDLKVIALVLLCGGAFLDAIDGAVARRSGVESEFGAFLDSTVDRFSDALPFIALSLLYTSRGEAEGVFLSFTSLVASFGVSYTKARAESLGVYGIGGVFERTERWLVLVIGIALDMIPLALIVISVGGLATTLQRVYEVKKTLDRRVL